MNFLSHDTIIRDITPRRLQRSNAVRGRSASRTARRPRWSRYFGAIGHCHVHSMYGVVVFDLLTRVLDQLSVIREPWRVLSNYTTGITLFYAIILCNGYLLDKFRRPPASARI